MTPPAQSLSQQHREIWNRKPVLKTVYGDYYRRILAYRTQGPILEVGGGSGNFKSICDDLVSIDIQKLPWLDVVGDAHALPFASASWNNIAMVDTLHHLHRPRSFLQEAQRVLAPGGRLLLVEPAITLVSFLVYRFLHPEPVRMSEDPLAGGAEPAADRDPFDSNQAIPTLLFERQRTRFQQEFPGLELLTAERFSPFSYLLSGGFRRWSLLPASKASGILRLEEKLTPYLKPMAAFRLFVVLERRSDA